MARRSRSVPLWFVIVILAVAAVAYWIERRQAAPPVEQAPTSAEQRREQPPQPRPQTPGAQPAVDHVALGMPSAASQSNPDDYLIARPQYSLSYNRSRGIPNWVAWHLSGADIGDLERSQFAPDPDLPKGWYRVTPNDYRNAGYDRGHMCPSGDRTATKADNAATFYMTNIIPQAGDNNQGPWADLENHCRALARKGNELYIMAGGAGPFSTLPNGRVAVPASTWKIVVVLPEGDGDASRVTADTEVIAVMMPNVDGIRERDWQSFRVPISEIARATGFAFLMVVPESARTRLVR
jgi:endonuclease G